MHCLVLPVGEGVQWKAKMTLLEFECQSNRFALPLANVRRVTPSALPTPLPGAPAIVKGILNIGGDIVAVIDILQRLGWTSTAIDISHRLVIIDIAGFALGFLVDSVHGITERDLSEVSPVPDKLEAAPYVTGMLRLSDGLCIIFDPEKFLFDNEKKALAVALGEVTDARQ